MSFSSEDYKRLKELLEAERVNAAEYLALTEEQTGILSSEEFDVDKLQVNMNWRQRNINRFNEARDAAEELKRAMGLEGADEVMREGVLKAEAEIVELLRKAAEIDEVNSKKANENMRFIQKEAKRISDNKKGFSGYYQSTKMPGSEYFDKKQ